MADGPARLAAKVPLAALRGDDRWRFGEQLTDRAELVRDPKRLDARPGLVGFDKTIHERVKTRQRFLQDLFSPARIVLPRLATRPRRGSLVFVAHLEAGVALFLGLGVAGPTVDDRVHGIQS